MNMIKVLTAHTVALPNGYEEVPYNPDTIIQHGWKFYFGFDQCWEDTLCVGDIMKLASDGGRTTYIRPIPAPLKPYTVIAVAFERPSQFVVHTFAQSIMFAKEFIENRCDEETGCGPYEVVAVFEGHLTNLDTVPSVTFAWNPPNYKK